MSQADVDAVLDYFCTVAHLQQIFFLWRPLLPDPKDDMVLELAVAARCPSIITYNVRDFVGAAYEGVLRGVPDVRPEERDKRSDSRIQRTRPVRATKPRR